MSTLCIDLKVALVLEVGATRWGKEFEQMLALPVTVAITRVLLVLKQPKFSVFVEPRMPTNFFQA